jgi:hypothetical protein
MKEPRVTKLGDESIAMLRHVLVHGPCTNKELLKAVGNRSTAGNLVNCGYFTPDRTQREVRMALTNKARIYLANPLLPRAAHPARRDKVEQAIKAPTYKVTLPGSLRPGAMVAFTLPSRIGDRLHYRDGRVTDMTGAPL